MGEMKRRKVWTASEMGRKGGKLGGKVRMSQLSQQEREEFARQGGLVGGKARAKKLTPEQRSEIARKAARARWAKRKAAESESGE